PLEKDAQAEAREKRLELRLGERADVRRIAQALDLVVDRRLRRIFGGYLVGDQQAGSGPRDTDDFAEHAFRPRELMKRGAARDDVEYAIGERQPLDVAEDEADVGETAALRLDTRMLDEDVRAIDTDGLAASPRERHGQESRTAS